MLGCSLFFAPETKKGSIKVLIRDKFTGLYQVSAKRWTKRPSEAHDFKQGLHALRAVTDEGLTNAEIVYDFEGMRESIVVPALNVCSAK